MLEDPDFVVQLDIERITKSVNGRGRTSTEERADTITATRPQPASPRERETLPEADRVKETISIHTLSPLTEDTRVLWSGATWRIAAVEKWSDVDGDYYRALAVREELS